MADISPLLLTPALKVMFQIDVLSDEAAHPNVNRWFKEISSRPAVVEVRKMWLEYMGRPAEE